MQYLRGTECTNTIFYSRHCLKADPNQYLSRKIFYVRKLEAASKMKIQVP